MAPPAGASRKARTLTQHARAAVAITHSRRNYSPGARMNWLKAQLQRLGNWLSVTPRPTIVSLFFMSGPAAIARLVVAIVIDAIKRMPWRPRAHMVNKRLEAVSPFVAHSYAAPAVAVVLIIVSVVTSALSVVPRMIFGLYGAVCCVAVDQIGRIGLPVAAAAFCMSASKFRAGHGNLFSAIAKAEPARHSLSARTEITCRPRFHQKIGEALPFKVFQRHGGILS